MVDPTGAFMFGIWRTALALEVALYHLAGIPLIGEYAVGSFFVLSGYLMTAIMTQSYGYTLKGRLRFFANRALRLFPGYWFSIAVTLALIAFIGGPYMAAYHQGMQVPTTAGSWLQNLSMLFLDIKPPSQLPRLTPPSWALTVEWLYYLLIGLGVARTAVLGNLWLALSIIFNIALFWHDPYSPLLYGSLPAGSLGFAAGAWTYHHRDRIGQWLELALGRAALLVILCGMVAAFLMPFASKHLVHLYADPIGNWLNVGMSALMVIALKGLKAGPALRNLDKRLGDLSYPLYLLHWQAGAVASFFLFGEAIHGASTQGLIAFALAMPIALILCLPQMLLIDPLVARYRDTVRNTKALVAKTA